MKVYISAILGSLIILTAFMTTAKAEGFKEGKWSLTMVTKMENMPPEMAAAMKQMENMPPEARAMMQQRMEQMGFSMSGNPADGMTVTVTQCLTKLNPVPKNTKMPQDCQETHEMSGNTVNFHANCKHNDVQMDSTGVMTYTGDSMEGHIKSHETRSGKAIDAAINITGKYTGPCP